MSKAKKTQSINWKVVIFATSIIGILAMLVFSSNSDNNVILTPDLKDELCHEMSVYTEYCTDNGIQGDVCATQIFEKIPRLYKITETQFYETVSYCYPPKQPEIDPIKGMLHEDYQGTDVQYESTLKVALSYSNSIYALEVETRNSTESSTKVLDVTYSNRATTSEEFAIDVSDIVVAILALLDQGWDVNEIQAKTRFNWKTVTWHVSPEWIVDYREGILEDYEVVQKTFQTVEAME